MIKVTNQGTLIQTKLVGTSATKIQLNLFDISILPEKVEKSSFEIDINTLMCKVRHWNVEMEIGKLQFKYLDYVISRKVFLSNFKITGLDEYGDMKHKNVGINVELKLSN